MNPHGLRRWRLRVPKWNALGTLGNVVQRVGCSKGIGQLQALFRGLPEVSDHLGQATEGLEKRFLAIGSDVERLSELSQELVTTSEELLRLATGQVTGEDVLQSAIAELRRPVEFLDLSQERSARVLDRLREHLRLVTEVRAMEADMQQVVAPLRYIQTFFRIESATLPTEVQHVFNSLTTDIEQLHERVVNLFGEQFKSLAKAQSTLQRLVQRLEFQLREHRRLAEERKRQIETALSDMERALVENRAHDVRLTGMTREIDQEVGRIVCGLQFQDITRQKIEHVRAAVGRMGEEFAGLTSARWYRGRPHGPAIEFIYSTGQVQVGQLEAVRDDLTRAEEDIRKGVEGILAKAETLDDDCMTLQNTQSVSVAEDGVVQVVLNTIADIRAFTTALLGMQRETHEAIAPLGTMASNLTGVMRHLSMNIRLIALNAQIQAANIGLGTGLEVLSQRTCNISDEAGAVNDRAAAELDRLTAGFEELVRESAELRQLIESEQAWLGQNGAGIERKLHDYRDTALRVFRTVDELARNLRDHAEASLSRLTFCEAACRPLEGLRGELERVVEICRTCRVQGKAAGEGGLPDLHSLYTMASEREMHRAVINREAGGGGEVNVTREAGAEVDFFTEPAGPPPEVTSAEGGGDREPESAEVFAGILDGSSIRRVEAEGEDGEDPGGPRFEVAKSPVAEGVMLETCESRGEEETGCETSRSEAPKAGAGRVTASLGDNVELF